MPWAREIKQVRIGANRINQPQNVSAVAISVVARDGILYALQTANIALRLTDSLMCRVNAGITAA